MQNIFIGKTNIDCVTSLIEKLKQNYLTNKNAHHIFIVPDRVSVLTEIKIFEALNIESTCSIEVQTLSRIASQVVDNVRVIPKTSSCMLFQKLLKQYRNDLKCFNKKIDIDLASTLYKTISQFKSCKIAPEEVNVTTQNKLLEDKLNDIAILYSAYQRHLRENELLDSMDRLDFVIDKISQNEKIKNSFVYIGFFDAFTLQGYQIISGIINSCIEFNIGLTSTDNSINEHIYDNALKDNILKIMEAQNKEPNIIFCKENVSGQFKYLQDNLYGFNYYPLKLKESNIRLFEGKTFEEEVLFCCSNIKNLIESGKYKFKDFVVAVPNLLEKHNEIERIFNSYNFNFYIDISENLANSILVRFIDQLVQVVLENFSRVSVLSFIKNKLLNLDYNDIEDFEDYIIKYNLNNGYQIKNSKIENSKFYSGFNNCRNALFDMTSEFIDDIKNSKTYNDFILSLEKILLKLNIPEKLVDYTIYYTSINNIKQAKLFEQYYNNLTTVLDSLREILGNEECDFKLFYSTLLSGISETKISTPPLSTNAIFIGDASTSFFDNSKVYFILNADEKSFPFSMNDCGIISDKEINQLNDYYKLEPSIQSINSKERFKSFELILKAKEKLFISYNFSVSPKSKILDDISKMFIIEESNNKFKTLQLDNYNRQDFYVINNNLSTASNNLISKLREVYDGKGDADEKVAILFNAVNRTKKVVDLKKFDFKNIINLSNNVFFTKDSISVSQVENYMTCPFIHFVRFGLNLKEKDIGELDNLNIGNILHNVAKVFIDNNSLPLKSEKEIGVNVEKAFNEVINRDVYESVKNNLLNKVLIKNLLSEAKRFCSILNYQAKFSSFKSFKTEIRFDDNGIIKSLKINLGNRILKLVGQVDRIDVFEDYFRIIDYKTGKCDTSLKELFFGKKVQLEAYLKVIESSLKLKPAGAYYMPVKSGIADENSSLQLKYQLKGRTIDNEKIIVASDNRLAGEELTSDIIDIKYNKKDEKEEKKLSAYSKVINSKDIETLSNYAINLISKTCKDILALNITPSPLVLGSDNPCKNCSYIGLCRFDEKCGNIKRQPTAKISIQNFIKHNDEEIVKG